MMTEAGLRALPDRWRHTAEGLRREIANHPPLRQSNESKEARACVLEACADMLTRSLDALALVPPSPATARDGMRYLVCEECGCAAFTEEPRLPREQREWLHLMCMRAIENDRRGVGMERAADQAIDSACLPPPAALSPAAPPREAVPTDDEGDPFDSDKSARAKARNPVPSHVGLPCSRARGAPRCEMCAAGSPHRCVQLVLAPAQPVAPPLDRREAERAVLARTRGYAASLLAPPETTGTGASERGGMSLDRVRAVTRFYADALSLAAQAAPRSENYEHLIGMVPRLHALLNEGRIEKAMRWLGFMQGALWAEGLFTLDDLKRHSRPDAPVPVMGDWFAANPVTAPLAPPAGAKGETVEWARKVIAASWAWAGAAVPPTEADVAGVLGSSAVGPPPLSCPPPEVSEWGLTIAKRAYLRALLDRTLDPSKVSPAASYAEVLASCGPPPSDASMLMSVAEAVRDETYDATVRAVTQDGNARSWPLVERAVNLDQILARATRPEAKGGE